MHDKNNFTKKIFRWVCTFLPLMFFFCTQNIEKSKVLFVCQCLNENEMTIHIFIGIMLMSTKYKYTWTKRIVLVFIWKFWRGLEIKFYHSEWKIGESTKCQIPVILNIFDVWPKTILLVITVIWIINIGI